MPLPDFPIPKMSIMRKMCVGDIKIFQQGKTHCQRAVSSTASKIGGGFQMKTVVLVEPSTGTCKKVVLVTCIENPRPAKKRGRKRK